MKTVVSDTYTLLSTAAIAHRDEQDADVTFASYIGMSPTRRNTWHLRDHGPEFRMQRGMKVAFRFGDYALTGRVTGPVAHTACYVVWAVHARTMRNGRSFGIGGESLLLVPTEASGEWRCLPRWDNQVWDLQSPYAQSPYAPWR